MPKPERTAIYRFYDMSDRLLYVGIAKSPEKRWKDHELTKRWWHLVARNEVAWLDSREAALTAEAVAVENEAPLYNAIRRADGSYEHLRYDDSVEIQRAAEAMRGELSDGTLAPGDPVHLVVLARRYGVSAISVLSAIDHLPPSAIECRANKRFVTDPARTRPNRSTGSRPVAVPHDYFWQLGFPG